MINLSKCQSPSREWYQLYRPDGPQWPGRSVFGSHNSESNVNSQFPRITKASAYPPTSPPSRPISQEYLRRWEKRGREYSCIINHAARFNRCSSELQDHMASKISMLCILWLHLCNAPLFSDDFFLMYFVRQNRISQRTRQHV